MYESVEKVEVGGRGARDILNTNRERGRAVHFFAFGVAGKIKGRGRGRSKHDVGAPSSPSSFYILLAAAGGTIA
jgi:hypothetical protein